MIDYSDVLTFDDHAPRNSQIKKMASIDVNKQVLSECIKKALDYLTAGGRA